MVNDLFELTNALSGIVSHPAVTAPAIAPVLSLNGNTWNFGPGGVVEGTHPGDPGSCYTDAFGNVSVHFQVADYNTVIYDIEIGYFSGEVWTPFGNFTGTSGSIAISYDTAGDVQARFREINTGLYVGDPSNVISILTPLPTVEAYGNVAMTDETYYDIHFSWSTYANIRWSFDTQVASTSGLDTGSGFTRMSLPTAPAGDDTWLMISYYETNTNVGFKYEASGGYGVLQMPTISNGFEKNDWPAAHPGAGDSIWQGDWFSSLNLNLTIGNLDSAHYAIVQADWGSGLTDVSGNLVAGVNDISFYGIGCPASAIIELRARVISAFDGAEIIPANAVMFATRMPMETPSLNCTAITDVTTNASISFTGSWTQGTPYGYIVEVTISDPAMTAGSYSNSVAVGSVETGVTWSSPSEFSYSYIPSDSDPFSVEYWAADGTASLTPSIKAIVNSSYGV